MKAEEILQASVGVMKRLLTSDGMTESIKRAEGRGAEANAELLTSARKQINDLVCRLLQEDDPEKIVQQTPQELLDGLVLRYLRNRDLFMKSFPDGIDGLDPDPVAIWGAMMISPGDEALEP